jgi:hypothetical protein
LPQLPFFLHDGEEREGEQLRILHEGYPGLSTILKVKFTVIT